MILYCLFLTLSISAQAFFGPSEETKENWETMINHESSNSVKKYLEYHSEEIEYGLKEVIKAKSQKEVTFQNNAMGQSDWNHFFGGTLLAGIGGLALLFAFIAVNNEVVIDSSTDIVTLALAGASLCEGMLFIKNSKDKKYSQDEIEKLKTIEYELLKAQQKNTSKK